MLESLFLFVEPYPSAVAKLSRAQFFPVVTIWFSVHAEQLLMPVMPQTTELLCKNKTKKSHSHENGELQSAASSDRLELPYVSSGRECVRRKAKLTEQRELVRELARKASSDPN